MYWIPLDEWDIFLNGVEYLGGHQMNFIRLKTGLNLEHIHDRYGATENLDVDDKNKRFQLRQNFRLDGEF